MGKHYAEGALPPPPRPKIDSSLPPLTLPERVLPPSEPTAAMPPLHHYTTPPAHKPPPRRRPSLVLRIIAGLFGILAAASTYWVPPAEVHTLVALLGFCGLTLGYAFGGDKWGARLFAIFTGHRVHVDDEPAPPSPPTDPKK